MWLSAAFCAARSPFEGKMKENDILGARWRSVEGK
jgi:hypothetical protein